MASLGLATSRLTTAIARRQGWQRSSALSAALTVLLLGLGCLPAKGQARRHRASFGRKRVVPPSLSFAHELSDRDGRPKLLDGSRGAGSHHQDRRYPAVRWFPAPRELAGCSTWSLVGLLFPAVKHPGVQGGLATDVRDGVPSRHGCKIPGRRERWCDRESRDRFSGVAAIGSACLVSNPTRPRASSRPTLPAFRPVLS